MNLKLIALTTGLVIAVALPALAHHSFAAEYDDTKPVAVTGTVTKVEWSNPHIWFYVDAKDDSGTVVNWGFSGGPPASLIRRGISKDALKVGDVITVSGYRAKDGTHNASGGNVTFADGRKVFAGSGEDQTPKK